MSQWPQRLYLAEIGCAEGPLQAAWMDAFLKSFSADERLSGFIYYNYADGKNNEPDWRLERDAKTLKVFRDYLQGR